jgi:hypothetical protein
MTARQQRGAALLVGGLLALIFSAIAAVQVAGWTVGAVERTDRQVIHGRVDELSVEAGAGEITIVPSRGDVIVDSTVKGSVHAPRLRAVKQGATVRLDGNCPEISFGPCRVSIVIHVPPETIVAVRSGSGDLSASGLTGPVRMETGSGDVHAAGLTGDAELRTSSGSVFARGLRGVTQLETASGDIEAEDLSTERIQAVTSSGDVELDFMTAPTDVDAATTSGDVSVAVPRGGSYRVEADSGSGDFHPDVRIDPYAFRVIRANTSSGDISVGYGN